MQVFLGRHVATFRHNNRYRHLQIYVQNDKDIKGFENIFSLGNIIPSQNESREPESRYYFTIDAQSLVNSNTIIQKMIAYCRLCALYHTYRTRNLKTIRPNFPNEIDEIVLFAWVGLSTEDKLLCTGNYFYNRKKKLLD